MFTCLTKKLYASQLRSKEVHTHRHTQLYIKWVVLRKQDGMNTAWDWFRQQSHLTAIIAIPTQTFLSLRDWFRQQSHLTAIIAIPTQTFLSLRDWFRQQSHLTAIPTQTFLSLRDWFRQQSHLTATIAIPTQTFLSLTHFAPDCPLFFLCLLLIFIFVYQDHLTQLLPFAWDFIAKGQRLVWGQVG